MSSKEEAIMSRICALTLALVAAVCVTAPSALFADVYDYFSDGHYWEDPNDEFDLPPGYPYGDRGFDPNEWDIDDPHWSFFPLLAGQAYARVVSNSVVDEGLWMWCTFNPVWAANCFFAAAPDDLDYDPNTSTTYFDDATNHYALTWVLYSGAYEGQDPNYPLDPNGQDPNEDRSTALIIMHGDASTWNGFGFNYDFGNCTTGDWGPSRYYNYHGNIQTFSGTDFRNAARFWLDVFDPNTPNIDMWERTGFWMMMQFEIDPNYDPGDPHGKFIRCAMWGGDKYDWDGTFLLDVECSGPWYGGIDPNGWYWSTGRTAVVSESGTAYQNGYPADITYDNIEIRTGIFTNVSRTLTVKLKDCCELNLEPNLAHPDGGEKRRYTNGTPLVLDTVVPCGNKAFKKWTVKGPNDSGDPLYQIVTDTNEVLFLTMDGDYLVKATCKCGGGGVEPFAGMALLLLGIGVAIRKAS
jgi:hypothetical protein